MAERKESKVMIELEELRARHAEEMEGLSLEERVRKYREEGEKAIKELGLTLPVRERVKA